MLSTRRLHRLGGESARLRHTEQRCKVGLSHCCHSVASRWSQSPSRKCSSLCSLLWVLFAVLCRLTAADQAVAGSLAKAVGDKAARVDGVGTGLHRISAEATKLALYPLDTWKSRKQATPSYTFAWYLTLADTCSCLFVFSPVALRGTTLWRDGRVPAPPHVHGCLPGCGLSLEAEAASWLLQHLHRFLALCHEVPKLLLYSPYQAAGFETHPPNAESLSWVRASPAMRRST